MLASRTTENFAPPVLVKDALQLRAQIQAEYEILRKVTALSNILGSFSQYEYAQGIVRSRAFPIEMIDSPDGIAEVCMALWPGLDLTNHEAMSPFEPFFNETTGEAFVVAHDDLPLGGEVFHNYGRYKSNAELLLNYGFLIPHRQADFCELEFGTATKPFQTTIIAGSLPPRGTNRLPLSNDLIHNNFY